MTPPPSATLSHRFTVGIDGQRHRLWTLALGAYPNDPSQQANAESLLQTAVRDVFAAIEQDAVLDPLATVLAELQKHAASRQPDAIAPPSSAMPADVWARLVAAVQVQASKSAHSSALNPDSVLLTPDPLLAPKRVKTPHDTDGLDLSPYTRFLLAGALALLIGITITAYVLTRPGTRTPSTLPASSPATKAAP